MEIWKDIPGYEGSYQVSNCGQVKSVNYKLSGKERILKPGKNGGGYLMLALRKNSKRKAFQVHQIVAMSFLGHVPDGMNIVVNHIDNNKLNNHVNNLELVSQRYNSSCHKTDVGVCWVKERNKWLSLIYIKGKYIYLGRFNDKEDALHMYQKALANIHLYDGDAKTFTNTLNTI